MAKDGYGSVREDSLFYALVEDLKLPLLRIAFEAELTAADTIHSTAADALKLLDSYLLSTRAQASFELEPVNPSAVIFDVAHELSAQAKRLDCQLLVKNLPAHPTVLMNRQALRSALTAVGMVLIEAQGMLSGSRGIELTTYKSDAGIAVGIFQQYQAAVMSARQLARARQHAGTASRPFAGLASGAAAQLFIAERLLQGMQSSLRVVKRGGRNGLAADLSLSSQLQLV